MRVALYKVRVEHQEYNLFTIAEVSAINKSDAERQAKDRFEWITGTPPERSKIGYVWVPKEHQYPNNLNENY